MKHIEEGKERKRRQVVIKKKKKTVTAYNTPGIGKISNFHL
jgi:hypothetical protein